jgi:signal transduction histidine kinase
MRGFLLRFVLQRRYWPPMALAWAGVAGLSLYLSLLDLRRQNLESAMAGGRNMFQMVLLTRQWNAEAGPVYLPVSDRVQPNPLLENPHRDVSTVDGQNLTMVNPAYMTRMIGEIAARQSEVKFHITSLKPLRPANAADPWEQRALGEFERGQKEVAELVPSADGLMFRYMAPLPVNAACLPCHAQQGYQVGDVRGGISVDQPFRPFEQASRPTVFKEVIQHAVMFLAVLLLGWWALEQLRRHWLALRDKIEELEHTQGELVQSEKLASLGRMVAGFAHELNTPVGVAVAAASHGRETVAEIDALLQAEEVHEDEFKSRLDILRQSSELILSNLRRAAGLVTSFKRTSVDQSSEQARVFEFAEVIEDVRFSLHSALKRLPIEIEVECPAGLRIDGSPGLYGQIFTNLILNSVQHGFEEGTRAGRIRIQARMEGTGRLRIDYADDGVGVTPEAAQRMFEPFYTTRRGQGGTGLGLFICHSIVTGQLGGSIACRSAPGSGAHFRIELPVRTGSGQPQREVPP